MADYLQHGRRHGPNGSDPIPGLATATADAFASPVILPILLGESDSFDGFGWTGVRVDSTVRNGAVRVNSSSLALNDYFTVGCILGPKGSIWGLVSSYKSGPDCGKIQFSLASVPSPNPNRSGTNDEGTLTDNAVTFVDIGAALDTYSASAADASNNGYQATFRLTGDDGATLTAITGTDSYTGFSDLDGGAGFYRVRAKITGKNASSSGFKGQLTGVAFFRLDDAGFL